MKLQVTVNIPDTTNLPELYRDWSNHRVNICLSRMFAEELGIALTGQIDVGTDPAGMIGKDEPVRLFRATDVLFPAVLAKYAELLKLHHCSQGIIDDTLEQERDARQWQRQNGCKLPDAIEGGE